MHGMNWYNKRRSDMIDYLGGSCVSCGTEENLEFDHIDPRLKKFNVSTNYSIAWSELVKELDKCQLLCKPCHQEKTRNTNITHNRWRYMKHKCRCNACREDYRIYRRERFVRTSM